VPIEVFPDETAMMTSIGIAVVIGVAAIAGTIITIAVARTVAPARTNADTDADRTRADKYALRACRY
jgi:hypothetical protein